MRENDNCETPGKNYQLYTYIDVYMYICVFMVINDTYFSLPTIL